MDKTEMVAALQRWQAAQLLSQKQVAAILAHEGLHEELGAAPSLPSPWSALVAAIGALVLGLGLIALVTANWQAIPDLAKLLGLAALMLGSYGAGYALRDRVGATWQGTGAAFYLLGSVLFGALLAFLSQGLQLDTSINILLLLWALGLTALAYAAYLPAALHLALPVGAVLPLLSLAGYSEDWLSTLSNNARFGLIGGVGAAFMGLTFAHPLRLRALSNPWAFWSAPLMLGAALTLSADNFNEHGLMYFKILLTALLALAISYLGQRFGRRAWINWGLLGVGAVVLWVYLDVFSKLLSASAVLIGAGAVLLAAGYGLERARRRLNEAAHE